ncbi:MAG: DUF2955 domain-containing protein [Gammaproteobacteria bacterium]|nr:DUF2955 domain-containing protein [Gammaproteobacteria bacterium]
MTSMPLQARWVFRLAFVVTVSLVIAYAIAMPLPFIAPIFAVMLTAKPAPPIQAKQLFGLVLVVFLTMAIGLLLIPMLLHYSFSALFVVALGIYISFYITLNKGEVLVGMFLTVGFTLISAAGTYNFALATTLIQALTIGIIVAVISQWIIYPFFPEDTVPQAPPTTASASQSNWIALRGTIVVLPIYLLVLINPGFYLPIMMKGVSLAQQSSEVDVRDAGNELLGSTLLGGLFAIVFWIMLSIFPHLWMYALYMLLFCIYFASKIYQLLPTKYPASYWVNVIVTMLILLGTTVNDSSTGKDVYQAFFIRMSLFILVTLYAVAAVHVMEYLRSCHLAKKPGLENTGGSTDYKIDMPEFS